MTFVDTQPPNADRQSPEKSHDNPAVVEQRRAARGAPGPTFLAVFNQADLRAHRSCIYALFDPRAPSVVMYVGKTTGHVITRLEGHLREARQWSPEWHSWTRRHGWIAALVAGGVSPSIGVLEVAADLEELDAAEQYWIRFFKYRGEAELNGQVRLAAFHGITVRHGNQYSRQTP